MLKKVIWVLGLLFIILLVRYFYFKPMLVFGQPAPSFEYPDINGNNINLKDFEGQYLLLDFWGSWCMPCRKENPIIVMMYEKYHTRKFKKANQFNILSVALEKDAEKAKPAIEKDGLIWPYHIVQNQILQSPIALLFGIKQIPFKYLIGPQGQILLSDPSIKELDDFLARESL